MKTKEKVLSACGRCGGTGEHSFHLIHGTVCFGCKGSGKVFINKKSDVEIARVEKAKQARIDAREKRGNTFIAISDVIRKNTNELIGNKYNIDAPDYDTASYAFAMVDIAHRDIFSINISNLRDKIISWMEIK